MKILRGEDEGSFHSDDTRVDDGDVRGMFLVNLAGNTCDDADHDGDDREEEVGHASIPERFGDLRRGGHDAAGKDLTDAAADKKPTRIFAHTPKCQYWLATQTRETSLIKFTKIEHVVQPRELEPQLYLRKARYPDNSKLYPVTPTRGIFAFVRKRTTSTLPTPSPSTMSTRHPLPSNNNSPDAVQPTSLCRWSSGSSTREKLLSPEIDATTDDDSQVHFRVDAALNAKVALWKGAIWTLEVDAIVNPTSESLADDNEVSGEILNAAGDEIYVEISATGSCRTGDAVASRGCQLPAKKIIHTVGPRYNEKYKIAAENALHGCYRNIMRVAKEEHVATVAIPCIYRKKKNYPREDATHVALRTVRRFLEHYGDDFDLVIFVMEDLSDMQLYCKWLPVYFPRSRGEEAMSMAMLQASPDINVGDAFGEPVIEERKIRISSWEDDEDGETDNQREDPAMQRLHKDSLVTKEFCEMKASPDDERLESLRKRNIISKTTPTTSPAVLTYQTCLEQAKQEDFEDIASLALIYRAGLDHAGAPVLMVVGKNLPVHTIDLDRVMLYVIRVMDAVVERKYTVIYAHGGVTHDNQPSTAWLKQLFKTFSSKYRDNLKAFYILEATLWLKMTVWLCKSFVNSHFYAKLAFLDTRADLNQVSPALVLPEGKKDN
ncbi:Aste57867_20620 [Aphanomyces stellatus]|uniref:Aste57867_20620 protein n=1 Tax=Aphanomyces stellatus TaxID=120398 RepID=A0A485LK30_9STRA|nr:hypothetical protein As57867_020552 [Aphanomyces stellatus]VFT97300.1 Aste57867_20620 [Aphanomyces stellatus]